LKDHKMTIGQEWDAVVQAFKIKELSIEEK
jgi:hypothetical protein